MRHEPELAMKLVLADLVSKVARLTRRVELAEGRIKRARKIIREMRVSPTIHGPEIQRDESAAFALMAEICAPIAEAAGMRVENLIARDRRDFVVIARQEAMRACNEAGFSASIIGRFLDGRDHATIAYGIGAAKARKIAANQPDNACPSGPFVQDSGRAAGVRQHPHGSNRRSTWIRGATMADNGHYQDSAINGKTEHSATARPQG